MAKKLLAILLAITMVVPMVLSQAFAATPAGSETYTVATIFDSDAGHGYSQAPSGNYPDKAYHLMSRFVVDWTDDGSDGQHGSITWVNGSPNSTYGFDLMNDTIFIAMAGWNGQVGGEYATLAEEPFELEDGGYYQVDWYVSSTEIKGYVNGEFVIDYVGEGLWDAGSYIISYPYACGYEILDVVVTAQDNSSTYVAGLAGWSFGSPGYTENAVVDFTVDTYEIVDPAILAAPVIDLINAIGNVGYNEWVSVTDTNAMSYEAAAGWGPYTDVQSGQNNPYRLEIDAQLVENKDGESILGVFPHSGGGAFLGYSVDAQKFFIAPNNGYPDYENYYANKAVETEGTYTLDTSKVYTIGFVYASNYVAIEFQGKEVLRSTNYSFASGDTHFPVVNAKFNIFGYRSSLLSSGAVTMEDNWSVFSSNATLGKGITCTADKFVNSLAAITAAEEAYAALSADAKAAVTNYSTLTAARTTYDNKVQAAAQGEANVVIGMINDIGEVTLADKDAIIAAEDAYAGLDPYVQGLVSNYADLTAARAAYNTIVANLANYNKLVNRIGTVVYDGEGNRDTDYLNQGMAIVEHGSGMDGYSTLKVNGTTQLPFDYRMVFDFQINEVDANTDFSQFMMGAQNFAIGYDFTTQKFVLHMNADKSDGPNPWTNLDPEAADAYASYAFNLQLGFVYTWDLQVKGNRITLYIDGVKVLERADGTAESLIRRDGNYLIIWPRYCESIVANFTRYIDTGTGWVTWYEATTSFGTGPDNLSGLDLINSTAWSDHMAGYSALPVEMFAQGPNDSDHTIAAAEAAYEALTAYEKTEVTAAYATMTAARETYDGYAAAGAAAPVMALIDAIGTVTLDSGDAIVAAEEAYAALDAETQALVANYATLTAARATYNALVKARDDAAAAAAVDAAIAAIGTVYYDEDQSDKAGEMGVLVNSTSSSDGYNHIQGLGAMNADFSIEFDFLPISDNGEQYSWFGFGMSNGVGLGYSYRAQKFFIADDARLFGDAARDLDYVSDFFPFNSSKIYTVKFDVTASASAIYVDGVKVVEAPLGYGGDWAIWYTKGASYKMANLTIVKGGVTQCEGVMGDDLRSANAFWQQTGAYDAAGAAVPLTAPATLDSGDQISGARAAYEALTADQKALVTKLADLEAAEELYAELSNPAPAVVWGDADGDGEVTLADAVAICDYDAGLITLEDLAEGADADGDGEITLADAVAICDYDAGLLTLEELGPQA